MGPPCKPPPQDSTCPCPSASIPTIYIPLSEHHLLFLFIRLALHPQHVVSRISNSSPREKRSSSLSDRFGTHVSDPRRPSGWSSSLLTMMYIGDLMGSMEPYLMWKRRWHSLKKPMNWGAGIGTVCIFSILLQLTFLSSPCSLSNRLMLTIS